MKSNLMLIEPELSFDNLHREFNNFLRDTFLESSLALPSSEKIMAMRPAIELKQTDKDYKVKIQLPGVKKEDIHVDVENDSLTISAEIKQEKKEEKKEENEKIHTSEFRYGKYTRTIVFDNPIKADDSVAEYKDGVLSIVMPKQKVEKPETKHLTVK